MKQSFFSKRVVALLLVLVIALTNLPDIVFAWGGDIFSAQQEQTVSDDGQNQQIPQEVAGVTLSFAPEAEKSTVQMGETGTFYMNVNVPETIDTQIAVRLPQHALQAINQAQPEGVQWMDTMGGSVPVELYQDGDSTILQFSLSAGQALVNQPLNLLYQNGYNEEISIPVTEQDITVNETWLQTEQPVEPVASETPEETLPPTDGDAEVPEGGETGGIEVPGGNETGDGETGGNETGDGETGDVEVPEGGETGNETGGNETGGNETGGNETGGSEVGGETGGSEVGSETGSETGESEAGKEELSNAQQQEQFQTEGEALQQESQSEGTVELQGVQIVKEFVARPSTELEPQGNNGEPADQQQDGEPADQPEDGEPADQQQDGDPAGQQQDDDPADQPEDGDPADQPQDDDPAGQQQDGDPADQPQDGDPAGQQQDGEPTEQPENTTPPQVIHQISGGTLTFAVQPFSWGELSLVEGPAEPDDGQPKRSDLFETQPRTVSKVFAMSSVLCQMGMVQHAERTIYKNNGQSTSLSKKKTSSGEETSKERIIDQDFFYHVTIQSENDAQTGTIYTREWTLEQSFTLPQGLQYPTGDAQVVGNQVLIGEVPVVTIENLDVTGNVSATAENISAVVNGSTLTITYIKTITDAENQDQELAAPDLQFVLHGSALKVLDEFTEGEIGVATNFKAISQTEQEITRSASAATPLSLGAPPDEGDPVPTEPSKIEVKYELLDRPTFATGGKLQVTYQITVENTSEDGTDAEVIITMDTPKETNTAIEPKIEGTEDAEKTWDTDAKTLTWGTTEEPVTIAAGASWTRTVTVTLTDDTQNEPPETLTSSVKVTSAKDSTELASATKDYPLKKFLEEQKETVTAGTQKKTLTQDIYWMDNGDASKRPKPENYTPRLAFYILEKGQSEDSVADSSFIELTEENKGLLGLSNINNINDLVKVEDQGNAYWQATASLPSSIYYGNNPDNSREVVWRMLPERNIESYTWWNSAAGPDESKKGKWYYLLEEPFTFTLDLRNGEGKEPSQDTIRDLIVNNFSLYYDAKNIQGGTGTITLGELIANNRTKNECVVEKNTDGTYTVKITGLGSYTVNGDRIQYALQRTDTSNDKLPTEGIGDTNDWLTCSYETHGVSNEKLFDGDTMILTLQGYTTYTANKVWLDTGDTTQRPTGRFELWRYRPGKETWEQASPVYGADGKILTVQLDTSGNQTIEFVDASGKPIQLDKYGPEGYEYIYVCKEIIEKEGSSDYEQVFGAVNEDGTVTDTPPEGMEGVERQEGNIYVYNKGTLTNRITDSETISATKRWEASSFQSELSDFVVELQLYSRPKGSSEDTPWDIVEGEVLTMRDFTSETLEHSDSLSVPTYDEHGQELEYKFEEEKVYLKDDPQTNLLVIDEQTGEKVIRWDHNGQTVTFTSERQEDGTIVNKLKDTINYDFTKVWTGGWTADELKGISDGDGVTFTLYYHGKDGKNEEVLTIKLDGKADTEEKKVTVNEQEYTVTVQEQGALPKEEIGEDDAHWPVHIEGLPRYDEDGYQIEYFVFENNENGTTYVADYNIEHDPNTGNYDGEVINPKGPGGHRILVRKRWIDDSDLSHREDVIITAYYHMGEGKDDVKLGSVELKSNGVGMDYIYFDDKALQDNGITDYKLENVYVLETKVGSTDVIDGKAVEKDGQYLGDTNKVYANFHDYEITYSILDKDDEQNIAKQKVYVVSNRRLGSIDLTATKIWQDGGELRKALEEANITPVLVLEFDDQDKGKDGYKIDYEKNTVTLGGNDKVPIQNGTETDTDTGNGKAIVPLDLNGENNVGKDYYFFNLPKYNTLGEVAHYTITEMWYKGEDTTNIPIGECMEKDELIGTLNEISDAKLIELLKECSVTIKTTDYTTGHKDDSDDTDIQKMEVTNKLAATKDVSFHKTWIDHYVYRVLNKRPDIYLTLYRLNNTTNELEVVDPYRDRIWTEFMEGTGTDWPEYKWTCHFKDLPKYDEEGREIFYYATERMAADGKNFDYLPVELSYVTESGTATASEGELVNGKEWKLPVDGDEEAVLEGGTFTNRLEASAKISGVKLWDNLPYLWSPENLPTVTFTITQNGVHLSGDETTVGTTGGEDEGDTSTGGDGTGTDEGTDTGTGEGNDSGDGTDKGTVIASLTIKTGDWTSALRTDFEFTYKGEWKMDKNGDLTPINDVAEKYEEIPKYNVNGQQYIYTLTETIKFPDNQVEEEDQVFSKIESSGYQIKNEYNPTLGAIQVKKLLQVDTGWEQYPAVTIELVRKYTTDGSTYNDDAGFTQSLTWSSKDVADNAQNAIPDENGNIILEHLFTFEKLPIYQPNGYQYRYYVREKVNDYLNYESGVKGGNVENIEADFNGIFTSDATVGEDGYLKYNKGLEPTKTADGATPPVSATFGDRYEPESINLTGTKVWDDQDNVLNLRPTLEEMKSKFKLYRSAPEQPGQGNEIPKELVSDGTTWTWTPSDGTDATVKEWTYTIENLEKVAPNGMNWVYTVEEYKDGVKPYVPSSNSVGGKLSEDGMTYEMNRLTNSLKINLEFLKHWQEEDGTHLTNDYLGLGEITITGELYVAEGDGALRPASEYFTGDVWEEWFKGNYEFTKELTTTIGSGETVTFADLPRVNQAGTILYYAVAETKITAGGLTQEYEVTVDGQTLKHEIKGTDVLGGLFTPKDVTAETTESKTKLTIKLHNQLQTQELNVKKLWTDETGATLTDGLPEEVNLVIERKVNPTSPDDSRPVDEWKIVTDASGDPLVVKLLSTNQWQAKLTGLPTNGIEDKQLVTYIYRARELKADWTGPDVAETDILADDAKFGSDYTVSYADTSGTTVTNQRTHMVLTAEKRWLPSEPSTGDEVTLTLYQRLKGGADADWKPFTYEDGTSAEVKLDGKADTDTTRNCYEQPAWTAVWKDLPRADGTTLYEYKVEETVDELKDNLFGSVTPETIASDSTDKKFIVTNLPMGQLHIEKKDGEGKALEGVAFELQYKDSTGNWLPIDKNVCKAETVNARQETNADGKVSYTHLLLVGENGKQINYQIVEVSTQDGYNRLTSPIPVSFETADKPTDPYWTIGSKFIASEVTYTVHNNQYFQTINTGAGGFFWPGVAGAGAACAGVWYLAGRKRRKHNKRHSDR